MRLILLALSIVTAAQPARADLSTLMARPTRPTIADIEPVTEESIPPAGRTTFVSTLPRVAKLIAELEWAYPGAVYMPLGRDVVLIGDAIDAFYRAHGQPGRVARLNASGQSLHVPPDLIARWVESSGVDIGNLADSPGYVVFDGSSYKESSQSVKILSAVYAEYGRRGGRPSDLTDKFSFFNLFSTGRGANQVSPELNRESFLDHVRERLTLFPESIPLRTFASSTLLRGASEWHSNFLLLQEMPDGSVIAPAPPPPNDHQFRALILGEMRTIINTVSSADFLSRVQAHARYLGYVFPIGADDCQYHLEPTGN